VAYGAAAWMMGGINLPFFVTGFVILFYANAYNFADGLDGLAGTLLLSLAAGLTIMACTTGADVTSAYVATMLFGAVLPFLFLNAPPAKVFMGDVGSLPIGALLGAVACSLTLNSTPDTPLVSDWRMLAALVVISVMMFVELVPVPLQIFWVKCFKKRLFPYTPIHHAFERAGWPETRVVSMFALAQLLLAALAVSILFLR
jgi:phospho-N-acetylmuramoyl-pentapeptide-transferase